MSETKEPKEIWITANEADYLTRNECSDGYIRSSNKFGQPSVKYISETEHNRIVEELKKEIPQWISVEEKLPENDGEIVLAVYGTASMNGTSYQTKISVFIKANPQIEFSRDRFSGEFDWTKVTHWMPLPNPPKG